MAPNRDEKAEHKQDERIRSFFEALVFTAVPFVVLVIVTVVMARSGGELVWLLALGLCVPAILASGVFALFSKYRVALGILSGTAIGFVGLVVSCATVLSAS